MNREWKFSVVIAEIGLATTIAFAETNSVNSVSLVSTNISIAPTNLAQLLALPPEQLDKVDIARMNLLCAEGLPGATNLDVEQTLKTLDSWTLWVKINTERNYHRFVSNPTYYNFSLGDYRMAILSATLQQQYGVLYDPARAEPQLRGGPYAESDEVFFSNPNSIFINGLLTGKHYGTCSSMPMLFVAVAQRLGYPVHLELAKGHFIVRYDEGTNHFNVEATSPGYSVYGDDRYKDWPLPTTDEEIKSQHLFQPMNGRELLAACLDSRSACFNAIGDFEKSREAALAAHNLAPYVKDYQKQADHLTEKIEDKRKAEEWDKLVAEITKIVPPEGDKFDYYRDKKIDLQVYLFQTADLDGTEKGLADLKKELAMENPIDAPAMIKLSPLNPQPHTPVEIVVLPEKARYVTVDGQTIETLVKSPEQLREFFVEQRVFDKVAEVSRHKAEMAGMPAPAARPTSIQFQTPSGMTREERLRMLETELDQTLVEQNGEMPPKLQPAPQNPLQIPGISPQLQDFINAANQGNRFNNPTPGVPNVPNLPLPPEVQKAMNPLDGMPGFGQNTVMQSLPPDVSRQLESAMRMKQLLDSMPSPAKTNQ